MADCDPDADPDLEDSFTFVSPHSSFRSVLKWSNLQQDMATPAATTNDLLVEPLDQRALVLHMDRLQREQRELTERQAAETMSEAVRHSSSSAVMLPTDELDHLGSEQQPRWRHLPREEVQPCSTCMLTPRRRHSTGRRACRCAEETYASSDTLFVQERLSDSTRFLLQLPHDSSTWDLSWDEDDVNNNNNNNNEKRPSAVHRILLQPKMTQTRRHLEHELGEASAQAPTTTETSASSSSAGSPGPHPPLNNYVVPSRSLHWQGRMVIPPLFPMTTPENSKPTAQLTLDGAPDMMNFLTPPAPSRRKVG